jgi:hypothetical protein
MMHFPGHKRDAFLEWVEADFPETAVIEENYEPRTVPYDALLRGFVDCTDVMPREYCQMVSGKLGYWDDLQGLTYGLAATALLMARAVDDDAACAFLDKLVEAKS